MSFTTGDVLAAEVRFRIGNRLTLAQIGTYLNYNLQLIESKGSYYWDVVQTVANVPASGFFDLTAYVDIGKDMIFQIKPGYGKVIPRMWPDQVVVPDDSAGTSEVTSWYMVAPQAAGSPGQAIFTPASACPVALRHVYHAVAQPLDQTNLTAVPWNNQWMDETLILLTTSQIQMILGWSGWETLNMIATERVKLATSMFSSSRTHPGIFEANQMVVAGKGN